MLQSAVMKKHHTPLVIGNWKMNPPTQGEARKLFIAVRKSIIRKRLQVTVSVAPPAVYLSDLETLSPSRRIELMAQDVSPEAPGAHTGEIGLSMLQSLSVTGVIIGHSERRAKGETNEQVNEKVRVVLKAGLTGVVCVGEQKRDSHGHYFNAVETQVRSVLEAVKRTQYNQLVIAYEPIWAIGTGETATPEDAQEMKLFIQKIIADVCGRKAIEKIRIIYGGSVKPHNAEALLTTGQVDGFLVGGASLKAADFTSIIMSAHEYGKG